MFRSEGARERWVTIALIELPRRSYTHTQKGKKRFSNNRWSTLNYYVQQFNAPKGNLVHIHIHKLIYVPLLLVVCCVRCIPKFPVDVPNLPYGSEA